MSIAYLGLGSNLGNRTENINTALEMLNTKDIRTIKTSTIIETDPVDCPTKDKFLNAVVKIETNLSPATLLKTTLAIEESLGRKRTIKNGPRTIDIDILLFDDIKTTTPELTIPHPRMFERDFVIKPLKEIGLDIIEENLNVNN